MKTLNTQETAVVSGATETKTLTIAANSKAFKELISGIYSDKEFAITRELFANAWDAHVDAGISSRPFEVNAPSDFDPTFAVRDFGPSMSHELVMNLYSQLFMSTKDNPNSDESNKFTGKFGLGSKTPFAYTDAFQLSTYKDGIVNNYDIFMNDGVPQISLFSTQPTDDEDGVRVAFPVEKADFHSFYRAIRTASEGLDVLPIISGFSIELKRDEVVLSGSNFKYFGKNVAQSSYNGLRVRQGTVIYPLNSNAIANLPNDLFSFFSFNMQIDVPIGDLEVNTAREALSYDERTQTNLIKHLQTAHDELRDSMSASFKGVKTYAQFCNVHRQLSENFDNYFFQAVNGGLNFRGKEFAKYLAFKIYSKMVGPENKDGNGLTLSFSKKRFDSDYCLYSSSDINSLSVMSFRKGRGVSDSFSETRESKKSKLGMFKTITFTSGKSFSVVFERIVDNKPLFKSASRFRKIAKELNKLKGREVLWIRTTGDDRNIERQKAELLVQLGRPKIQFIDLADIEIEKGEAAERIVVKPPEYTNYCNSYYKPFRDPLPSDPTPQEAYYINRYAREPMTKRPLSTLIAALRKLQAANIIPDLPIIGVNSSQSSKIKNFPGWKELESVIEENIAKLINKDDVVTMLKSKLVKEVTSLDTNYPLNKMNNLLQYNQHISDNKLLDAHGSRNVKLGNQWAIRQEAKKNGIWDLYAFMREFTERKQSYVNNKIEVALAIMGSEELEAMFPQEYKVYSNKLESIVSRIDEFNTKYELLSYLNVHGDDSIFAVRKYLGLMK